MIRRIILVFKFRIKIDMGLRNWRTRLKTTIIVHPIKGKNEVVHTENRVLQNINEKRTPKSMRKMKNVTNTKIL